MLAVADPASYGARWVVSLDDQLRADLTAKKQPAVDTWKKITAMLAFFEQHKQARTYQPMGPLAVMSNFGGPDWDPGEEALNLLPRLRAAVPGDCAVAGSGRLLRRPAGDLLRRSGAAGTPSCGRN